MRSMSVVHEHEHVLMTQLTLWSSIMSSHDQC
jgi:hypothetical protein